MSSRNEILTETIDRLAIAADKQDMKQWLIECACGCKKTRLLFDKKGKMRRYIKGHGAHRP